MNTELNYRKFPKGDARRYFLVLLTASRLKARATLHYIAGEIGCTRAEAQRAITVLEEQFDVEWEKSDAAWIVKSWGVLNKNRVMALLGV